jgi:hypothetical protein
VLLHFYFSPTSSQSTPTLANHRSQSCILIDKKDRYKIIDIPVILQVADALEVETYFVHPYASRERGLNENTNGLLRPFIPKGTDLRKVTEEGLKRYQGALNSRPRKCLGFRQPSVVFAE